MTMAINAAPNLAAPTAASRNKPDGTIASCCTLQGATVSLSFDAADVAQQLRTNLEKRLGKKGITLYWTNEMNSPEIVIRVVRIDQGNQFLRYMLPFIAPAILEVEGKIAIDGSGPKKFHYTQKAQIGLFGGSAKAIPPGRP